MSDQAPDRSASPALTHRWDPSPVPAALRWGLHLLVAVLLLLTAGRSALGELPRWPWVVVGSALVGIVYAVGPRWTAVARSRRAAGAWLALLLAAWVALLLLTPDAIYLAFPWFFLLLHLLPRRAGLAGVAFTTAVAVAGFGWHQERFTAAMVIGPVLGAAVVIATVFGYQALLAESEQRRRLIVELDRTRNELAAAQHRAGVLDERERLAREIHDTLAQGLTSIQLLLQATIRSLAPGQELDPARAAGLAEQARQAAQENLAEARQFVRALAPADLDESTLPAALQRLCDTTTTRTGVPVSFHQVGQVPALPTPVEVALLRIAQAALGNVTQHADPSRADITLTGMDAAVTLDVVDDGIGFDIDALVPMTPASGGQRGFGLRSMRSRAAALGGVLSVESQPGQQNCSVGPFRTKPGCPGTAGPRGNASHGHAAVTPIRLLLADDHPVVRAGLRAVLESEPDIVVVDDVATAEAAIERAQTGDVDVVLMDLQFGTGLGGIAATGQIASLPAAPRVVVLTTYDTEADIIAAVEAGAAGYLLKDAPPEELIAAARAAAAGQSALAPAVTGRLLDRMRAPATSLSAREAQVLTLVADGLSNEQIAGQLFVSQATVKSHLVHIFTKLDCRLPHRRCRHRGSTRTHPARWLIGEAEAREATTSWCTKCCTPHRKGRLACASASV